jgi:hypothetical protein
MGSSMRRTRQEPSSAPQCDSTKTHRSAPRLRDSRYFKRHCPEASPPSRLSQLLGLTLDNAVAPFDFANSDCRVDPRDYDKRSAAVIGGLRQDGGAEFGPPFVYGS